MSYLSPGCNQTPKDEHGNDSLILESMNSAFSKYFVLEEPVKHMKVRMQHFLSSSGKSYCLEGSPYKIASGGHCPVYYKCETVP